jgi:hypothetical protein
MNWLNPNFVFSFFQRLKELMMSISTHDRVRMQLFLHLMTLIHAQLFSNSPDNFSDFFLTFEVSLKCKFFLLDFQDKNNRKMLYTINT